MRDRKDELNEDCGRRAIRVTYRAYSATDEQRESVWCNMHAGATRNSDG